MTLVPFEQYVLAAEKLISENPLGLKVSDKTPSQHSSQQRHEHSRVLDEAVVLNTHPCCIDMFHCFHHIWTCSLAVAQKPVRLLCGSGLVSCPRRTHTSWSRRPT